jgi:glycosyltransferase involved in cell wall biosynthesis
MNAPQGVSFVIPAFNCARFVPTAVASIVRGNVEPGDELIIVDDGSTDETPRVLAELSRQHAEIRVLTHRFNKGSAAAGRNTAIDQARNELIFCLDADNVLTPGSVPQLRRHLIDTGADAAAFEELRYFVDDPDRTHLTWRFPARTISLADALAGHVWPGPSGNYLFTRTSWLRAGRYHESVGGGIDSWAFGIRQLATGSRLEVLAGSNYRHRFGHESAWIIDSRSGNASLKALGVLLPFLHLLEDESVEYLFSRTGRTTWFDHLHQRPLRVRCQPAGQTGRIHSPNTGASGWVRRARQRMARLLASM